MQCVDRRLRELCLADLGGGRTTRRKRKRWPFDLGGGRKVAKGDDLFPSLETTLVRRRRKGNNIAKSFQMTNGNLEWHSDETTLSGNVNPAKNQKVVKRAKVMGFWEKTLKSDGVLRSDGQDGETPLLRCILQLASQTRCASCLICICICICISSKIIMLRRSRMRGYYKRLCMWYGVDCLHCLTTTGKNVPLLLHCLLW